MSTTTDLGKVGMTPKQTYNSTTAYERLDVVTHDGCSYVCLKDCAGIEVTNTEYWQLLADKGHFTEQDKEEFKQAVVESSKTQINEYTDNKKTELDNYTSNFETSLKNELDTYEIEKEAQLDIHKTTLETEMSNTKDSLVEEIETAQNGFNTNVETKTQDFDSNATAKTTAFNNNATEKTNTFNSNVETKTEDFDTNANTKTTEYNNNSTAKLEEYNNNSATKLEEYNSNDTAKLEAYNNNATEKTNSFNSNAEEKTAEFNENAEALTSRVKELETELEELSQQASWKTTDIAESIHITDSAKYSKNKLDIFGNMRQETREGINLLNLEGIGKNQYGIECLNNMDGSLTFTGTATQEYRLMLRSGVLEEGKVYSIKCQNATENCYVNMYYGGNIKANDTVLKVVVSDPSLDYRMYVVIPAGATVNSTIKPMLVEGRYTTETFPEFEQYGAMPSMEFESMPTVATGVQKITKCKKNFWKFDCVKVTPSNQTWFFLNGKADAWGTNIQNKTECYIKLKPGFYAFSYLKLHNCLLHIIDNNEKILINNNFPKTIEITEDTYIIPRFRNTEKNVETYVEGLQIEKVTSLTDKATEYEPYNGKDITLDLGTTELAKIVDANGNVIAQDKAVYRNVDGVWKRQWTKDILKKVFNGDENWMLAKDYGDGRYVFRAEETINNAEDDTYAVSNLLKNNNETGLIAKENTFRITKYSNNSKLFVCIKHKDITDVESWKNYLKDNNLIVFFKAVETQYEDCTAEQSAVLDKLHKLALEKGTNNIFVESENGVTTELQLTYMQDRKMLEEAKEKEYNDRLTAVENLLSTTATSAMLLDNLENDLKEEVGE